MNNVKTFFLLMVMSGLLLVVGAAFGGEAGIIFALIFAVVMNFGAYWFSDRIALKMAHAHPITEYDDPALFSIVAEQASNAGLPMPKVYEIASDSPNAFATGRSPKKATVAVTTGIRQLLNREELGGVLAHEMAHVGNRDTLIMAVVATIAGAISMLAMIAPVLDVLWRHGWRKGPWREHYRPPGRCHRNAPGGGSGAGGHLQDTGVPGRRDGRTAVGQPLRIGQRPGEVGDGQPGTPDEGGRGRLPSVYC